MVKIVVAMNRRIGSGRELVASNYEVSPCAESAAAAVIERFCCCKRLKALGPGRPAVLRWRLAHCERESEW
jgi:hypothetical protein